MHRIEKGWVYLLKNGTLVHFEDTDEDKAIRADWHAENLTESVVMIMNGREGMKAGLIRALNAERLLDILCQDEVVLGDLLRSVREDMKIQEETELDELLEKLQVDYE